MLSASSLSSPRNWMLTRDNDVSTSLRKVLDARQHLYEEVADVRIDTDHAGIDTVAGEVVKVWQS